MKLSSLVTRDVRSGSDETIGKVEDFILDLHGGFFISYLVRFTGVDGADPKAQYQVPLYAVRNPEQVADGKPLDLYPRFIDYLPDIPTLEDMKRYASPRIEGTLPKTHMPFVYGSIPDQIQRGSPGITDGRISYPVMEIEKFLELGEKLTLVPLNALNMSFGSETVYMETETDALSNVPTYEPGKLPDTGKPDWDSRLRSYWQRGTEAKSEAPSVTFVDTPEELSDPEGLPASVLMGMNVENGEGESFGKVEEILVDLAEATADFAVVGIGGFLGIGETEVAVPFESFSWDIENRKLILKASREKIRNAPEFDMTDFLGRSGVGNQKEIRRYWNK